MQTGLGTGLRTPVWRGRGGAQPREGLCLRAASFTPDPGPDGAPRPATGLLLEEAPTAGEPSAVASP